MTTTPHNTDSPAPTLNASTCVKCEFPLKGLPVGAKCPECGEPSLPESAYDSQTLGPYTLCPNCGYSLEGLSTDSRCPECGSPCKNALVKDALFRSGARYVRTLAGGARLALVSAYIAVFCILGSFLLPFLLLAINPTPAAGGGPIGLLLATWGYLALLLVAALVWLYAWLRITTPDPSKSGRPPNQTSRRWTRGSAITCFALPFMSFIPLASVDGISTLAQPVAGAVFFFSACVYIRGIAHRLSDKRLASTAKRVMITAAIAIPVLIASIFIFIVAAASALSTSPSNTFPGPMTTMIGVIGLIVGALLLLLIYLRLVSAFHKTMKKARARSQVIPDFPLPRDMLDTHA